MCGAFRTKRRPTGGSRTRAASENGAASRNGAFNKHRVLCRNDARDSSGARQNAATALQRRAKPNGPSAGHTLDTCAHYFQPAKPMNNGIARVAVLLAMVGWSLIAPQPAEAQFGGSLIVTVTSPASGSTVSGTVSVTGSVGGIGALTVRGVQFRLDGSNLGAEDTTAPYSVPWDTTTAGNGSHTLTAVARDSLGMLWTSDPVTVTVFNDTTPPAVSITSPASGTIVAGTISVTASASDNVRVVGVQFLLDGLNAGAEVTAAPYSVSWNTTTASNGSHSLTAVARDAAGNRATSVAVAVTVSNGAPPDTTPPMVSITSPTSGASVSGTLTMTANASDNVGVVGVQFLLDGANVGAEVTAAPYSAPWDTTTASRGSHTLTAVARDAAGNHATSAPVSVTVVNASPIVLENQQPGSGNWQMLLSGFQPADDTVKQIKGYASATSVNKGESITFYVTGTPRAVKVSWNRPYTARGEGQLLGWEVYFVRWLERSGYDVKYSTDVDTHENSTRLLQSKAFLSVGDDAYWSKEMYDGVQQARDASVHLGFFGASAVFWQVRFEASPLNRAADRVMVGYKDRTIDPVQGPTTTILWRDPFLNRPEQQLIGVQFTGEIAYDPMNQPPYVVANSSSWVYAGTGLADGTSIPRILGYQMDASMSGFPLPTSVAGTYQVLSQSPFTDSGGATVTANSSIYQAPSGAWVFGAGTTSWAWGLVDDGDGFVDPRIQQTTANLLQRFGALPSP